MTLEDAKKVALICMQADGNCSVCVKEMVRYLTFHFPDFQWGLVDPSTHEIQRFEGEDAVGGSQMHQIHVKRRPHGNSVRHS